MADLDTQLMNRSSVEPQEEKEAEKQIRQNKRQRSRQQKESYKKETQAQDSRQGQAETRRQQLLRSGRKKITERTKTRAKQKMAMPLRMYINSALRQSWIWLVASWGLTLIYINIHAYMSMIMPSLFCKLGDEWIPAPVKQASGFQGSKWGRVLEVMTLLFLDLVAIAIVFIVLGFIAVIGYIATNSLDAVIKVFGELIKMLWKMIN